MAEILRYKTFTGIEGAFLVKVTMSLNQIIAVKRNGEQKDFSGIINFSTLTGNEWSFIPMFKRVIFGNQFPFGPGGETIFVLYKEVI